MGGRLYCFVGFGGPVDHFGNIVVVVLCSVFVFVGGCRWVEVEEVFKAYPGVFRRGKVKVGSGVEGKWNVMVGMDG